LLDGLLALNIDLGMDAVATRLGMWDWGLGPAYEYFGVPYANFWAWFWVVVSFSTGLRLLTRLPGWIGRWLAPPGAIVVGVFGRPWHERLDHCYLIHAMVPPCDPIGTRRGAALADLDEAKAAPASDARPGILGAAWGFHTYFLLVGVLSGVILPAFLLLVNLAMMLVALYLHRPFVRGLLRV
jgi:hypothetical protein